MRLYAHTTTTSTMNLYSRAWIAVAFARSVTINKSQPTHNLALCIIYTYDYNPNDLRAMHKHPSVVAKTCSVYVARIGRWLAFWAIQSGPSKVTDATHTHTGMSVTQHITKTTKTMTKTSGNNCQ